MNLVQQTSFIFLIICEKVLNKCYTLCEIESHKCEKQKVIVVRNQVLKKSVLRYKIVIMRNEYAVVRYEVIL